LGVIANAGVLRPPKQRASVLKRSRNERETEKPKDPAAPPIENLYAVTLRSLPPQHRHFVRAVLGGATLQESAKVAGYRKPSAVVYLLGLAPVAEALQRLCPLMPDQAAARKALEPLLTARLVNTTREGGHAQRVSAVRELTNPTAPMVGEGATGRGSPAAAGGAATFEARRKAADERRAAARERLEVKRDRDASEAMQRGLSVTESEPGTEGGAEGSGGATFPGGSVGH
jgi:hypothetical protein